MSAKNRDRHGRWRSKTIAFRVSDEEYRAIDEAVSLAGMTKQDYIIRKLMNKDVVVVGNPRVHKALKSEMKKLCEALLRLTLFGALPSNFVSHPQMKTSTPPF